MNIVLEAIDRALRCTAVLPSVAARMKMWPSRWVPPLHHWFQPLTGTAEKHDSFIDFANDSRNIIERFSGKLLAQQEPGVGFGGGIRNTFEARVTASSLRYHR